MSKKRQTSPSGGSPAGGSDAGARAPRRGFAHLPLGVRIGLLAVLWVLVNGWTVLHFGRELTEIGTLNATLAAYGVILGLLPEKDRERATADWKEIGGRALRRLLDGRNLAVLYLLFLALGSFVSSVHVEAGEADASDVRVLEPDGEEVARSAFGEGEDLLRFPLVTTYAGRRVFVEPAGRKPYALDVLRPWFPRTVDIDDLPLPPGVRLRVPVVDLRHLTDHSYWVFECGESGERAVVPARVRGGVLLLGAAEPDPDALTGWLDELEGDSEAWQRRAREAWRNPEPVPALGCFDAGRRVRIVLCTPGQAMTGEVTVEMVAGVQDVQLERARGPDPCPDTAPPPTPE